MKSTCPRRQSPESRGAVRILGSSVRSLGGCHEKHRSQKAILGIAGSCQDLRFVSKVIRGLS
jgi:hypothetical protein